MAKFQSDWLTGKVNPLTKMVVTQGFGAKIKTVMETNTPRVMDDAMRIHGARRTHIKGVQNKNIPPRSRRARTHGSSEKLSLVRFSSEKTLLAPVPRIVSTVSTPVWHLPLSVPVQ